MPNIYEKRWNAAVSWFSEFKKKAEQNGVTHFLFDDCMIPICNLIINDKEIIVKSGEHYTYQIFENDKEYDHGLYTKTSDCIKKWKNDFRLFKEIEL